MPGFVAFLVGYPGSGQGAAVMVNSPGWKLMHEILRAVAVEYGWPGYVREWEVVTLPSGTLGRYLGRYQFETRPEVKPRIALREGSLYYSDRRMLAVAETRFVIPDGGYELEFSIDASGRATGFDFGEPGTRKIRARRID